MKAAHTKTLTIWCADASYHHCEGEHGRLRRACTWGLANYLYVLDTGGEVLSNHQVDEAVYSAQVFLRTYQQLAVNAVKKEMALWKTRPKGHYFAHMVDAMQASHMNPKSVHAFGDEDFIGRVTRIASATHGRTVHLRTL